MRLQLCPVEYVAFGMHDAATYVCFHLLYLRFGHLKEHCMDPHVPAALPEGGHCGRMFSPGTPLVLCVMINCYESHPAHVRAVTQL